MLITKAYAAPSAAAALEPWTIERREPGADDVLIEILYCGICHSDMSFVAGHFPFALYPMVPGHEIVGRVSKVGSAVQKYRAGDIVGVGCMVESCRGCADCREGEEQYCSALVPTYAGVEKDGKTPTFGGYSTQITVNQDFVLKISPKLSPAGAAPLLCAGITTYSPLKHWKVGKGSQVAVVGLGGLGHVAVKLARAMGAEVTVLSRSEKKRADALALGASDYGATSDPETFARLAGRFDLVLNTVSAVTDNDAYLSIIKRDGALVLVGVPDGALTMSPYSLMMKRRSVSGSAIGGIRETQEMLDFCAEHGIVADIEMVRIQDVNTAFKRIDASDVRYRFVIDMASLKEECMSTLRFVLVHGAWHVGSAWDATAAQLRALGHEVHTPTVAGHGHGVNKKLGHDDYVRSIVDYIEQHELREVVLVGHSLGGSVIARTAPKVVDRLRRLVFWNAFVPRDGEGLVSPMPQAPMFAALAAASGDNTVTIPFEYFRDAFINDADLDTARRAYAQLSPEPYAPVVEPLDCKDFEALVAGHRLPFSYLNCTEDSLLPWVSLMASRLGFYRLVQMPGSHEVLFSNPALLAQKLVEAGRD